MKNMNMSDKYVKNTIKGFNKWKSDSKSKALSYARAMTKFGAPIFSTMRNYSSGVDKVSSEKFANAIRGKGPKWKRKLKEAVC